MMLPFFSEKHDENPLKVSFISLVVLLSINFCCNFALFYSFLRMRLVDSSSKFIRA